MDTGVVTVQTQTLTFLVLIQVLIIFVFGLRVAIDSVLLTTFRAASEAPPRTRSLWGSIRPARTPSRQYFWRVFVWFLLSVPPPPPSTDDMREVKTGAFL